MLVDPSNPNFAGELKDAESAISALGQHIRVLNASNDREFDLVAATLAQDDPEHLRSAAIHSFWRGAIGSLRCRRTIRFRRCITTVKWSPWEA